MTFHTSPAAETHPHAGNFNVPKLSEVTRVGLEPTTYGLKVRCSTN